MLWPVLAGLVLYYAGLYPLRYLPLIKAQPREVAIQRAIHNSILIFLVALVLVAAAMLFLGPGGL